MLLNFIRKLNKTTNTLNTSTTCCKRT